MEADFKARGRGHKSNIGGYQQLKEAEKQIVQNL